MIHKASCSQAKRAKTVHPWEWAENKSLEQILYEAFRADVELRTCHTCNPFADWEGPFHACEFRNGCPCKARCQAYERHLEHVCCPL
jgi:hypothetical protein